MRQDNEVVLKHDTMITSETDHRGNILYANGDFCKIAEYDKEELIGKPHNIIRHPDMPKAAFKDLWDTIKQGKVWNGIVKNRTKTGKFYWVNATVFANEKSGQIRYISVRKKPTPQEVEAAEKLYGTMR